MLVRRAVAGKEMSVVGVEPELSTSAAFDDAVTLQVPVPAIYTTVS